VVLLRRVRPGVVASRTEQPATPGRTARGFDFPGCATRPNVEVRPHGHRDGAQRHRRRYRRRLRTRSGQRRRGVRLAWDRPHDHRARRRHRALQGDRLAADGRRRSRDPDRQAVQDGVARPPPRDHRRQDRDGADRAGLVHPHRRTVCGRERGTDDDGGEGREGCRRDGDARRCLQAPHVAVLLPGARRAGHRDPPGGAPPVRSAVRRRSGRGFAGGSCCRRRRLHPDRHAQRAELRAAQRGRAYEQAGDAEARSRDDDRGVAPGSGIHRAARQLRSHLVRARDPHVRALDAEHARPRRHGGRAAGVPPAGDGRSRRTRSASARWSRRWPARRSRPAPTR